MAFWSFAYRLGCVSIEQLRRAVISETNPYGEITPAEFKEISGESF